MLVLQYQSVSHHEAAEYISTFSLRLYVAPYINIHKEKHCQNKPVFREKLEFQELAELVERVLAK